jgi:acyl-CoA synthetase (AMP-forming)/AMP-acid ligase II
MPKGRSSETKDDSAMPPAPQTLYEVLLARCDRDPDQPFLLTTSVDAGAEIEVRSYQSAFSRIEQLRAVLEAHRVRTGEAIGCYLPNSPSWVIASFAAWGSGAVVAAVGTLLPGAEASRLFRLAGVRVVVRSAGARLPDSLFEEIEVDDEGRVRTDPATPDARQLVVAKPPSASSIACIFFTSGTTGDPKGVSHTHGDFIEGARRVAAAYARSDAYRPRAAPAELAPGVVFNPFGHVAGYGRLAFRMWIGRPTLLVPRFTVPAARSILERFEFDSLQLTPTMVHMLATSEEPISLGKVAYVTSGTSPLAVATRQRFEERFGVPVMQAYGMTEVGAVAQERLADVKAGRRGPGSVGRLAKGVEVQIRTIDGANSRGAGTDGEICVRSRNMPTEFVGGARVPVDDEGWFATGDIGHFDEDGILYITGRSSEKMIVGGFNVYPAEVEDAARQSEVVRDAVVVGLPDDRLGERPVAGIVWEGPPDESRLLSDLRQRLAAYKVPRAFFDLDAVPLTPRDKVDRRRAVELALLALAAPPVWDDERED